MASSIENYPLYPYPSEFNVTDFVPDKLTDSNYDEWKKLMLDFIESRGLVGFIDGPVEAPPAPPENEEQYRSWKRSDGLVRGWILTTLTKDILTRVLPFKTAKEVWTKLDAIFHSQTITFDKETEEILLAYQPLEIAAIKGDWESAIKFIEEVPYAVRVPITRFSETALMIAVRIIRRNDFVKKLLEKMVPEDLAQHDAVGHTALHIAAGVGNIEATKLLLEKNPTLSNVCDFRGRIALHYAAACGKREVVLYLLDATKQDQQRQPFDDKLGAVLLCDLYIALTLVQRYPNLACIEEVSPLEIIAAKCSSFRSETSLNFWQNLIYTYVPVELENIAKPHSGGDIKNPIDCLIYEVVRIFARALQEATSAGIHEIVENIIESCPTMIQFPTTKTQSIFQYAIACRRENVFNLVYQLEESSYIFLSRQDVSGNNALHLAAFLGPRQQLSLRVSAAGAALQMQRELQFFKEVEKLVQPRDKEVRNTNGMTPAEVFTDTHQELVKEGERWMKDTATSCTIVAALIVTVVFAAAITVPGGNNNNDGHPYFSKHKAFLIFGIFDALALFSSITSVLMFLSILTARYAEEDFLYALPKRLIIGLVMLFVSILSMMIAFGATLYLMFGDNKVWILVPVVGFSCIPVTLFAALQFPLLVVMIKSISGSGIFGKRSDRMLM
ncbi:hypothetical protein ACSBR1_007337 [Camellia fascicularis]